jgi:hypothetical protein
MNNFILKNLTEEESILPLVKFTTRLRIEQNVDMEKQGTLELVRMGLRLSTWANSLKFLSNQCSMVPKES